MVAGYRYDSKEMLAPFEYRGYTDQYLFSYWFEHMLCPTLKADDYVILDNAPVHNKQELLGASALRKDFGASKLPKSLSPASAV